MDVNGVQCGTCAVINLQEKSMFDCQVVSIYFVIYTGITVHEHDVGLKCICNFHHSWFVRLTHKRFGGSRQIGLVDSTPYLTSPPLRRS